jgi:cytochrome c biogenesis protein CcmG/thiol:disulfide interchange protein DsbE
MNRITHYLPLIFFIFLIIGLFTFLDNEESDLRSVLLDKNFPDFSLSKLKNQEIVTKNDLVELPSLLNVWATWCIDCRVEHPFLMRLIVK